MSWTEFLRGVSDLAPVLLAGLAPPATVKDLAALNSPLPNDVYQVLATNNGQLAGHRILFGLTLMGTQDITRHHRSVTRALERQRPVPVENLDARTRTSRIHTTFRCSRTTPGTSSASTCCRRRRACGVRSSSSDWTSPVPRSSPTRSIRSLRS